MMTLSSAGFVSGVLAREGFTVLEGIDGPAALAALLDHCGRLDLLVTDLQMPGMSGLELAHLVREARPEAAIVFMTGEPAATTKGAEEASQRSRPPTPPISRGSSPATGGVHPEGASSISARQHDLDAMKERASAPMLTPDPIGVGGRQAIWKEAQT